MCSGEAEERLAKLEGAIIFLRKGSAIIPTLPDTAACTSDSWFGTFSGFSSAALIICSVTAGPMFLNDGEKFDGRSRSFCLCTRLKNDTGALEFFLLLFYTFLIFPQTRVASMWFWV